MRPPATSSSVTPPTACRLPRRSQLYSRPGTGQGEAVFSVREALPPHEDLLPKFRAYEDRCPNAGCRADPVDGHSFNTSTFVGRVCASALAPVQSVLSASIGTLYGPHHGSADQAAQAMAREIGDPAGVGFRIIVSCMMNGCRVPETAVPSFCEIGCCRHKADSHATSHIDRLVP